MDDTKAARMALMREPSFRWLLGGGSLSMLGDQFTLIALPWLILKMTGDAFTLGVVIALMSVPRAVFILIGGALVDRFSPKRVLMLTKIANAILLGALATLVLTDHITPALVYTFALCLGLASAFSIPSGTSILPHVVAPAHLQIANGILMGMQQLVMLVGPLLAGLLIAFGGDGSASGNMSDAHGLGFAFGFDCFSFVLSTWTLSKVHAKPAASAHGRQALLRAVGAGLWMVWCDRLLRTCLIYWALVAMFVGGSLQVALPLLANIRLGGVSALGILMGAYGAGTMLGMAASSVVGRLRFGTLGTTLLVIDAIIGVLLIPMGQITAAWQGAAILLTIGALAGFMQITVFSWIQRRVPLEMMGRAMSIFMFIFMGLAPMSAAGTGWLMQYVSLDQLFVGSGCILMVIALLAYAITPMRTIMDADASTTGNVENAESP